jgi:hypothetical protein
VLRGRAVVFRRRAGDVLAGVDSVAWEDREGVARALNAAAEMVLTAVA